jgi:hypothetical protein
MLEWGLAGMKQGVLDRFQNISMISGKCEVREYFTLKIITAHISEWTCKINIKSNLTIGNAPEYSFCFK